MCSVVLERIFRWFMQSHVGNGLALNCTGRLRPARLGTVHFAGYFCWRLCVLLCNPVFVFCFFLFPPIFVWVHWTMNVCLTCATPRTVGKLLKPVFVSLRRSAVVQREMHDVLAALKILCTLKILLFRFLLFCTGLDEQLNLTCFWK